MCNKPFKAYRAIEGGLTLDPAKSIDGFKREYPCKSCWACKKQYQTQWATRLDHESHEHEESMFVTCTYNEENLPPDGSLNRDHPSKFIRALRQKIAPKKVRFWSASEYGEPNIEQKLSGHKFGRPHFHQLIFGWKPDDLEPFKDNEGIITYTSEFLETVWGKGFVTVGDVTPLSCNYVAAYTAKKQYGNQKPDHYTTTNPMTGDIIHMEPEFSTGSNRPGIGFKFFERWLTDFFPSDFFIRKGQKVAVPKYYLDKLEFINPEMRAEVKQRRCDSRNARRADNIPARLITKEKILEINHKRKLREAKL